MFLCMFAVDSDTPGAPIEIGHRRTLPASLWPNFGLAVTLPLYIDVSSEPAGHIPVET